MLTLVMCIAIVALSVVIGQAVLTLCGRNEWDWLNGPVGLACLMALAGAARYVPAGPLVVGAVALIALPLAAVVLLLRRRIAPRLLDLACVLPLFGLVFIPFASAGYFGILGVSFNNDMATHLSIAEAFRDPSFFDWVNPGGYPIGPHALAGTISSLTGSSVAFSFSALTCAIPVLAGMTALSAVRSMSLVRRLLFSSLVGVPFLVAGFLGQGSFKEIGAAMYLMATAIYLQNYRRFGGPARLIPLAALTSGMVVLYTFWGLIWLLGPVLVALLILASRRTARCELLFTTKDVRAVAFAVLGLTLLLAPHVSSVVIFARDTLGRNLTGIEASNLGNLGGPVQAWTVLGVGDNPDYRQGAIDLFVTGAWVALASVLALFGVGWSLRRARWAVPVALAFGIAIWIASAATQSPYVAAKSLVIIAPVTALLMTQPLLEDETYDKRDSRVFVQALAAILVAAVAMRSLTNVTQALRTSFVGPLAHSTDIRALLKDVPPEESLLFLGNDDFMPWTLLGRDWRAPVVGFLRTDLRPGKSWAYGEALDFDSPSNEVLRDARWVVTTDAADGSLPQQSFTPEARRGGFVLWRRTSAPVSKHRVLNEGAGPAAVLRCSAKLRKRSRPGQTAMVRRRSVSIAIPPIAPGDSKTVTMPLGPGLWQLDVPYVSRIPVTISGPGFSRTLPPNLDRPGPRFMVSRIRTAGATGIPVTLQAESSWLTPAGSLAYPGSLIATPIPTGRQIPLADSCGALVDWIAG